MGFEHIVLYDNGSAVPAARPPAGLAAAGLLTVIDFPRREAPQLSAYYHCLRQWKTHSRWLAFIDIDEFVLPLARRDVRDLPEACEAWAGLAARWMVFSSGGHLRSYTNGVCLRHHVKSLMRPQWALKPLPPHHVACAEGRFCVNEDCVPYWEPLPIPWREKSASIIIFIHHSRMLRKRFNAAWLPPYTGAMAGPWGIFTGRAAGQVRLIRPLRLFRSCGRRLAACRLKNRRRGHAGLRGPP